MNEKGIYGECEKCDNCIQVLSRVTKTDDIKAPIVEMGDDIRGIIE